MWGVLGTLRCTNETKLPVSMAFTFVPKVENEERRKCSENSEAGAANDGCAGRRGVRVREGVVG